MEILTKSSRPEVLREARVSEPHTIALAANHVARHPPANCRELALELSDASLSGVVTNEPYPGPGRDGDRFGIQAVGRNLLCQQMLATDLDLFLFAVARDFDDFH